MIYLNIYVIGVIITFLTISIASIIDCKDKVFTEPSFICALGYSLVWPFYVPFILLQLIFG